MVKPTKYRELILHWNKYKYFPYEKELGLLEVSSLFHPHKILQDSISVKLETKDAIKLKDIQRLAYFEKAELNNRSFATQQYLLEQASNASNGNVSKKQSTRYSSHGLHEYKGKFNPQVVRGLLNYLDIKEGSRILEPFCGSGTTLIESFHMGMNSIGIDINPLAIYVTNAKILALTENLDVIQKTGNLIIALVKKGRRLNKTISEPERAVYLRNWFPEEVFCCIESFRQIVTKNAGTLAPIFLSIASNLLRDYSLQEPSDLRIRRRKSPMPQEPFLEAYVRTFNHFMLSVKASRTILNRKRNNTQAHVGDICHISHSLKKKIGHNFHCALTSPPYATALPYIDTQRLSLVWLGLCEPSEILNLDAKLIGSRELRGEDKGILSTQMISNHNNIPPILHDFCIELNQSIAPTDGFRRRAIPILLYRYLSDMKKGFTNIKSLLLNKAPYALIVGHNHTTIGGKRFDIDTPQFLVLIAKQVGWEYERTIELQTYQRYGLHMKNAVAKESLIVLRKS